MNIKIEGNPGTGNTFQEIHIGTVQNYNPKATTIINYNGTREATPAAEQPQEEQHSKTEEPKAETAKSPFDRQQEPEENIDCTPIRKEILNYVSCVRPLVAPDKKDKYIKMWEGILELDAVKAFVYKTGKQKETNFNRKLIANILHHLDIHRMYKAPYKASDLAKALEGDYDKSVRGELGKYPSEYMASEIDKYLETLNL